MKRIRPAPGRTYVNVLPVVVLKVDRPPAAFRKSPPVAPLILVVIDLVTWPDQLIEDACRRMDWLVSDRTADLMLKALVLLACAVTAGLVRRVRRRRHLHPGAGSAGPARAPRVDGF